MIFHSLWEPTQSIYGLRRLSFFPLPLMDTDMKRMFTHSYVSLTALGRWHVFFTSELKRLAWQHKWAPLTTAELMTYRGSLWAWQRFEVTTRLLYWDESHFYVEHAFIAKYRVPSKNQVFARALAQGVVRSAKTVLRPPVIFATLGPSPALADLPARTQDDIAQLKKIAV
ncbi:MAG: thioesterase family protein [Burkholderiales bacterium]